MCATVLTGSRAGRMTGRWVSQSFHRSQRYLLISIRAFDLRSLAKCEREFQQIGQRLKSMAYPSFRKKTSFIIVIYRCSIYRYLELCVPESRAFPSTSQCLLWGACRWPTQCPPPGIGLFLDSSEEAIWRHSMMALSESPGRPQKVHQETSHWK